MARILTTIFQGLALACFLTAPFQCLADGAKEKCDPTPKEEKNTPDMSKPKDRLKKLNGKLAAEDNGKLSEKERTEREKRLKIERERLEMMKKRKEKLDHPEKLGKLTEEEKRKIDEALKKLHSEPDDHKTGDEAEEDNTDKFDGDIDIDPEDDWDIDPELFGD